MQTIKHTNGYKNIHPIMDDIERLFTLTSDYIQNTGLLQPVFDHSFDYLLVYFLYMGNLISMLN